MMTCSTRQALLVWADLEDALRGEASHGHVTEIYAYRLVEHRPRGNDDEGIGLDAAAALTLILVQFMAHRACRIGVDAGRDDEGWAFVGQQIPPFDHRINVRVVRR